MHKGVNNPLTLYFKNSLHRLDSVGIRSLLQHLVRNGVQLKKNIRIHFLLYFFYQSDLQYPLSHNWHYLRHLSWSVTAAGQTTWHWTYAYWEHRLSALNVSRHFFDIVSECEWQVFRNAAPDRGRNLAWTNAVPSWFKGSLLNVDHSPVLNHSKRWGTSPSCWHNRK